MADITCLVCGKPRFRDFDLCSDCLQMTAQHDHDENQCIFDNCSARAVDKLDVCGNHLVETVYGLTIPYRPVVCNVEGCTERSIRDYPVCDQHWIIAYRSCLSANSGNAKASSKVSKFYHATDSKIAKEYRPRQVIVQRIDDSDDEDDEDDEDYDVNRSVQRPAERQHNAAPVPRCVEEDVHMQPHVARSSPRPIPKEEHLCRCGKPADPRGNKCPECFARYNALKFGVGNGKCQCGAPLGEKGSMCHACFMAFKKAKFGTKQVQPVNPLLAEPRPIQQMMPPFVPPMMVNPMMANPMMANPMMVHPMMRQFVPHMMRQYPQPMMRQLPQPMMRQFPPPICQESQQDMSDAPKENPPSDM